MLRMAVVMVLVAGATFTTEMIAMVVRAQVVVMMVMAIKAMMVVSGDYHGGGPSELHRQSWRWS